MKAYATDEPGTRVQFSLTVRDVELLGMLRAELGVEDLADTARLALRQAVSLCRGGVGKKLAAGAEVKLAAGCRIPPGRREGGRLVRWNQWIFRSDRRDLDSLKRFYGFRSRAESMRFAIRSEAARREVVPCPTKTN